MGGALSLGIAGIFSITDLSIVRLFQPSSTSSSSSYQISSYPPYIQKTIQQGSDLLCSGLSFAEIAHLIEKAEKQVSHYRSLKPKEYRHNHPQERTNVVTQVQSAWNQVANNFDASYLDCTVTESSVNAAMTRFQTQALDGYDLFILEAMHQNSITQVITDDGDYATVPSIQVFTANRNVINVAQQQGQLRTR